MLDGMTNIKASEVLKEIKYYTEDLPPYSPDEVAEALEMAIKALEPKPMEKFDDVKTHIQRLAGDYKCWDNRLTWEEALELNRMFEAQPNSNEFFNFDAPMVKTSEAVSREAVLHLYKTFWRCFVDDENADIFMNAIRDLPPVIPQRPKGKWIEVGSEDNPAEHHFECSECGQRLNWIDEYDHYCCNCGSKNWEG